MIRFYDWKPEWSTRRWFNLSGPSFKIGLPNNRVNFLWLWNAFNRHTAEGDHWWGVGVLQIGHRHLFFVGFCGISIAFIGKTA